MNINLFYQNKEIERLHFYQPRNHLQKKEIDLKSVSYLNIQIKLYQSCQIKAIEITIYLIKICIVLSEKLVFYFTITGLKIPKSN